MPVYIALLRGINVGGNKLVSMEKLRDSFARLGFTEVKTYINSGNVIFRGARVSTDALSRKIEKMIERDFGFPALVITRTAAEMKAALDGNPYLKESSIDSDHLHIMFLPEPPPAAALPELKKLTAAPDRSTCCGREIYFCLPNGVSKSSLANNPIERRLLRAATMRNWRTMSALCGIAAEYK
jgi:uncharacterized protein (DUF1697 family)